MCLTEETAQAYSDGEMEPGRRVEVDRHLASCQGCRDRVAAVAARHAGVDALLRDLGDEAPGQPAAVALARFQARVAARRVGGLAELGQAVTGAMRTTAALKALGAAAVLAFIAVGLGLLWPSRPPASRHDTAAASKEPQASRPVQVPNGPPEPGRTVRPAATPTPMPDSRPAHRTRRVSGSNPYYLVSDGAGSPEMGMVVRVRMRLSDLTPGLAGLRRTGGESVVEADVLFGEDGRARAIRFVNQTQPTGGK